MEQGNPPGRESLSEKWPLTILATAAAGTGDEIAEELAWRQTPSPKRRNVGARMPRRTADADEEGGRGAEQQVRGRARSGAAKEGLCINDALPEELLPLVIRKLPDFIALALARCVCKSWRQMASSPLNRPASSPLCCLLRCRARWRIMDLVSRKQRKLDITCGLSSEIRAQGGLVAWEDVAAGSYWVGNPLLKRWRQVPMCSRAWSRHKYFTLCGVRPYNPRAVVRTFELVVHTAPDGSASYQIVQFHTEDERDVYAFIYDSRTRLWTTQAHVLQQPFSSVMLAVQSCVWRKRVFVLVCSCPGQEMGIWEYLGLQEDAAGIDAFREVVPLATPPGKKGNRFTMKWFEPLGFQVQVARAEHAWPSVHLVASNPPVPGSTQYPPLQKFVWDASRKQWVVEVDVEDGDGDGSGRLSRFWKDPWPEDGDWPSGGFLVGALPNDSRLGLSVFRTDTLEEWYHSYSVHLKDTAVTELDTSAERNVPVRGCCFVANMEVLP